MVRKPITMKNISLIVTFAIIFMVSYTWAECTPKSVVKESNTFRVTNSYLNSRNSGWERFKNIMKGRLVDPICTSKEEVMNALCECVTKKPKDSKKGENKETKESCIWTALSNPDGTSTLKYANMYPCGDDVYVTQGYAAYDGDVHDVFVVEEKKENKSSSFIFKEVAREIDFKVFKENNHSYVRQLYSQLLSVILNLDKHIFS